MDPNDAPVVAGEPGGRRAPALYVIGRASPDGTARTFRLPCPPGWTGARAAGHAIERRVRPLYFAALDALAGRNADHAVFGRLVRIRAQTRAAAQDATLRHLVTVFGAARRAPAPLVPPPPAPLAEVEIQVPPALAGAPPELLAARFAWDLRWLVTRGYVVTTGLVVHWAVQSGS
jgi:hypothetical protein